MCNRRVADRPMMCKCGLAAEGRPHMSDRIERSVLIEATLDRVWDLVTEPGWWVPSQTPAPIDRTPGATAIRESEQWGRFPVRVVSLDPKTYAAFRWASTNPGEDLT